MLVSVMSWALFACYFCYACYFVYLLMLEKTSHFGTGNLTFNICNTLSIECIMHTKGENVECHRSRAEHYQIMGQKCQWMKLNHSTNKNNEKRVLFPIVIA